MEDLWQEAGIMDDEEKKLSIGKYADQKAEEGWQALETYDPGNTWEEFKDELLENYLEAVAAERGTPARIRQVCQEAKGIVIGDLTTLYSFKRAFVAKAKKLQKPLAAMANRELVELFFSALSNSMAQAVLQHLGSHIKDERESKGKDSKEKEGSALQRPEDHYDLEEVCKAAVQVSENAQGMLHLSDKPSGSPGSRLLECG